MSFNKLQKLALSVMRNGDNVYLSGAAGTGKSYVINTFIDDIRHTNKNIIVCAPTGIAAINIGGATMHRTFGAPAEPIPFGREPSNIPDTVILADTIVIDEISMCRFDLFQYCYKVIKGASERAKPEHRHKQIIVVGDFYQLPPVITDNDKEQLRPELNGTSGRGFAFEAPAWAECGFKQIVLTDVVRQANSEFAHALNAVRIGDKAGLNWIEQHSAKKEQNAGAYLCARNKDAAKINDTQLGKLKGDKKTYYAEERGTVKSSERVAPSELTLKIDAKVMILVNDTSTDFQYQNGTICTVKECRTNSVLVRLPNGKTTELQPFEWKVIKYNRKDDRIIPEEIGSYKQIPLKLAYAITIHKSQGQTYDAINIYPSCFDAGQLYVGLSRCQNINTMHIMGDTIGDDNMIVSQAVRDFYNDNILQYNAVQCNTDIPKPQPAKNEKTEEKMMDNQIKQMPQKEPTPEPTPAKNVTMQIRADDATKSQFTALCDTLHITQGAAMQTLLHVYELEQAKGAITGSADIIDNVRSHVDSIINAFIVQLETNQNADNRIRQEYADKIDTLEKTIADYQNREQQARNAADAAMKERDDVIANAEIEKSQSSAMVAAAEERAQKAEERATLADTAASDARRIADAQSARVNELIAERDKLRDASERADALAADLAAARAEVTATKNAAEIAAARAEVELTQSVAKAKEESFNKIENLLAEISRVKDELHNVKSERDNLQMQLNALNDNAKI